MKKAILLAALGLGVCSAAQAQITDAGNKFSDNWSFTVKGGGVFATQTATGESFLKSGRGIIGAEIRKQVTPTFGIGVEGEWSFNTSSWTGEKSANTFDHQYVGAFGAINLMNLFASYTGQPRVFEIEAVAGAGWLHSYYPHSNGLDTHDGNSFATKVGLNFNFNLGEAKAWTISLKPALLWNMNGDVDKNTFSNLGYDSHYNYNNMYFELEAGLTYHFGNSNGTHSFVLVQPFDQAEVDALNMQINNLRGDMEAAGASNAALLAQIADLQAQLDACNKRPPVEKVIKDLDNVRYVFFNIGSDNIQANQQPSIAMTANQVKENAGSTVTVKGYASKDGSKAFNEKLAQRRAEAVKKALVNTYGVSADRVNAEGMGIGDLFTTNDWNRVAVMTVND